jgi:hypothetical protein
VQEFEPGLFSIGKQFGVTGDMPVAVMTGGLVQEYKHVVLPEVTPRTTFLFSLFSFVVSNNALISCHKETRLTHCGPVFFPLYLSQIINSK